jgi:hypothetical protein
MSVPSESATASVSVQRAQQRDHFAALTPLRDQLAHHPMYARLTTLPALRAFMQQHVFAVWDFMSLVKTLQRRLTCLDMPWRPPSYPEQARIINEVVLSEESDIGPGGRPGSHFSFYLEAMREVGADTGPITTFLQAQHDGLTVDAALALANPHPNTVAFVTHTLSVVRADTHIVVANFLYGREALIPSMFERLREVTQPLAVPTLEWYFSRHIALDGGEHAPAALELLAQVCGHDQQRIVEADTFARKALSMRALLWNGVLETIEALASASEPA